MYLAIMKVTKNDMHSYGSTLSNCLSDHTEKGDD